MPMNSWTPSEKDYCLAYETKAKAGSQVIDICEAIGISVATYYKWNKEFKKKFKLFDFRKSVLVKKNKKKMKLKKPKIKGSRLLTPELRKRIILLVENEHSLDEVAEICRINRSSIFNWENVIPGFRQEIKFAKSLAHLQVKKALKRRAVGCRIEDTIVTRIYNSQGRLVSRINKIHNRELPGNVTAQQFYLINREGWRKDAESKVTDNKGDILKTIKDMAEMTGEEILDDKGEE